MLGQAVGRPVTIRLAGGTLYPGLDLPGISYLLSLALCVALLTLGVLLAPHLLVEEKEHRTLDVLFVTPVSYPQVLFSKALAGAFYSLVGAAAVLLLSAHRVVQWDVLAVGVLLGVLFAVVVGLALGVVLEEPASVNLWGGLVLALLIIPAFLASFKQPSWAST